MDDFVFQVGTGAPGEWKAAPVPDLAIAPYAGADGTDRAAFAWPRGSLANTWLRVIVRANEDTGLASPDVFYFGNLAGDTGNDRRTPIVNAADLLATARAIGKTDAASLARFDFTRDGRISAADVLVVRNNQGHALPLFTAVANPAAADNFGNVSIPGTQRVPTRPPRRGVLDPAEPPLLA
jgi:hypothetical protein